MCVKILVFNIVQHRPYRDRTNRKYNIWLMVVKLEAASICCHHIPTHFHLPGVSSVTQTSGAEAPADTAERQMWFPPRQPAYLPFAFFFPLLSVSFFFRHGYSHSGWNSLFFFFFKLIQSHLTVEVSDLSFFHWGCIFLTCGSRPRCTFLRGRCTRPQLHYPLFWRVYIFLTWFQGTDCSFKDVLIWSAFFRSLRLDFWAVCLQLWQSVDSLVPLSREKPMRMMTCL